MISRASERVLIATGSNEGDRAATIRDAVAALDARDDFDVEATSALHETAPVGGPPQGPYLNGALVGRTTLEPLALLRVLKDLERAAGRDLSGDAPRWGPRPLDLDLLLFGDRRLDGPELEVPHPRMAERRFVLAPAVEVAPDWMHPDLGRTLSQLLEALP